MKNREQRRPVLETKDSPHSLSSRETELVVSIVDVQEEWADELAESLGKITPDNASSVINDGERRLREKRRASAVEEPDKPLVEQFGDFLDRSSRLSHAIQCSVNKEEDIVFLLAELNRRAGGDERAADAAKALDRQARLNALMTELFKCDILRRIGKAKLDNDYIEQGRRNAAGLMVRVEKMLDEFEEANREKLGGAPEAGRVLAALRQDLRSDDPVDFAENFYTHIARPFSELVGYDLEEFNEDEITEALRAAVK